MNKPNKPMFEKMDITTLMSKFQDPILRMIKSSNSFSKSFLHSVLCPKELIQRRVISSFFEEVFNEIKFIRWGFFWVHNYAFATGAVQCH